MNENCIERKDKGEVRKKTYPNKSSRSRKKTERIESECGFTSKTIIQKKS